MKRPRHTLPRYLFALGVGAVALTATGCYPYYHHHHPRAEVAVAVDTSTAGDDYDYPTPPPLREEVVATSPGVDYVWVPGYWDWSHNDYVWIGGTWTLPPYPPRRLGAPALGAPRLTGLLRPRLLASLRRPRRWTRLDPTPSPRRTSAPIAQRRPRQ